MDPVIEAVLRDKLVELNVSMVGVEERVESTAKTLAALTDDLARLQQQHAALTKALE